MHSLFIQVAEGEVILETEATEINNSPPEGLELLEEDSLHINDSS